MKYVWMILRTDLVSVLNKSKGGTKDKLQLALLPILGLYWPAALFTVHVCFSGTLSLTSPRFRGWLMPWLSSSSTVWLSM